MSTDKQADEKVCGKQVSISSLLAEHFYHLIRDIIIPIRVIISVFIVFLIFLVVDQLLFLVFDWLCRDIKTRITFVSWLLDGVQVVSIVAVSICFIYNTITSLQSQRQIASKIESNAQISENN